MEPNKKKVSDFSGARVGDRVWDIMYGWGEIISIDNTVYPLEVEFDNLVETYTAEGHAHEGHVTPSLFWDEIKFEIPAPPKREVKVRCKGYLSVYPKPCYYGGTMWPSPPSSVFGATITDQAEITFELTLNEDQLSDLPFEYEVIS